MALARSKSNANGEFFRQRYSELSDEIRALNKREDRFLDIRLKFYEREKKIRLNILRKEQNQLERTRSSLIEQWNKIHHDNRVRFLPPPPPPSNRTSDNTSLPPFLQLSAPELTNPDWESSISAQLEIISTNNQNNLLVPSSTTNVVRPHSAV